MPDLEFLARSGLRRHLAERNGRLTAEIFREFEAAGLNPILLKGAATRALLSDSGRTSADVDLLVGPDEWRRARKLLTRLGYRCARGSHAESWTHDNRVPVDLHRTLTRVGTSPARTWQVLHSHRMALRVGDHQLHVLDVPAQLVHLAIHATQVSQRRRVGGRSLHDLRRAIDSVDAEMWEQASLVARDLKVGPTIAWSLTEAGEPELAALFGRPHLALRQLSDAGVLPLLSSRTHWSERARRLGLLAARLLTWKTRRQREVVERMRGGGDDEGFGPTV